MSWPLVKFKEIAPAKAIWPTVKADTPVWQITLDDIEANTGRVITKDIRPLSEAGSSTIGFNKNHVLYSKLRPYLNKVILPDEIGVGTSELIPMLPDESRLDRTYLAHYLRSPDFVKWASTRTTGAKMPRTSMKDFWEFKIPLPPLAEQKRIAGILDRAEGLARKRARAITLTNTLLRSVFLDMFGDPVTNPMGWEVGTIDQAINHIEAGWSAKGEARPALEGEFGVLKISAVTSGLFKASENKVVSAIPKNKKLVFPQKGDLLFSRANTRELVAATCIVDQDYDNVFLPDKLWKLKLNNKIAEEPFLKFVLSHEDYRRQLCSRATGTSGSMLNISKAKLLSMPIPLPPVQLQKKFSDFFSKSANLEQRLVCSQESSTTLTASLTQRAFRGELTG